MRECAGDREERERRGGERVELSADLVYYVGGRDDRDDRVDEVHVVEDQAYREQNEEHRAKASHYLDVSLGHLKEDSVLNVSDLLCILGRCLRALPHNEVAEERTCRARYLRGDRGSVPSVLAVAD